jgi:hypothetical protein
VHTDLAAHDDGQAFADGEARVSFSPNNLQSNKQPASNS